MRNEINILIDSLIKKKSYLKEILEDSITQLEMVSSDNPSLEEFDCLVDHKSDLLDKIDRSDEGFDIVFKKIRNDLVEQKDMYAAEVRQMQDLIREILDLGSDIHKTEQQIKEKLSPVLKQHKSRLYKEKADGKAVMDYYKQANQMNYVSPAFLDQKK